MEFIFLGTSAGKPTKERNVSSLTLRLDQTSSWLLFDCGEATQNQILKTKIHFGKIDKIFITHLHADHFLGLFGFLCTRDMQNITSPLEIYAPKGLKEILDTLKKISQLNFDYKLEIYEIKNNDIFDFKNFKVEIIELKHSIESYAFFIEEKSKPKINKEKLIKENIPPSSIYKELQDGKDVVLDSGKVLKAKDYLIKKDPRRVIIAGDNADPYILLDKLKKSDLLIHESTYTQDVFDSLKKKQKHTTSKTLALAAKKANIKNLIATHISARYSLLKKDNSHFIGEIEEEIREFFDGNFFVAKDFDRFYLNENKKLIFYGNVRGC